jgi:hypothetical protein
LYNPDRNADVKVILLLDMPLTLGNSFTIKPEFQLTKNFTLESDSMTPHLDGKSTADQDIYGGVSIHFAY